jgi:hypothetical protein
MVGTEAVEGAIFLVICHYTLACSVFHYQVHSKILDEEISVMSERLAIKGVEKGVSCSICSSTAPVRLASLSVLLRLSTEGSLVAGKSQLQTLRHTFSTHILPSSVLENGHP